MTSRLTIAFLSIFLLVNNISAKNMTPKKTAKSIYMKAQWNLKNLNYETILIKKKRKQEITRKQFHKVNKDGTVFTRSIYIYEPPNKTSSLGSPYFVKNSAGYFHVFKNKAVKMDYQVGAAKLDETGLKISYSMKDGTYKGVPCYIITKRIKPNTLAYKRYLESLPPSIMSIIKDKNKLKKSLRIVTVAYIGKNNNFFCKQNYYGVNGKSLGMYDYGKVIINPTFDDDLFKIPVSAKIQITKSIKEYADATSEIITKTVTRDMGKNKSLK